MTAPGWYPDPNDENTELYWDGQQWHGTRERLGSRSHHAVPDAPSTTRRQRVLGTRASIGVLIGFILVAAAIIAAIVIANKRPTEPSADYQLGYDSGTSGTAATTTRGGAEPHDACQSALTFEYLFTNDDFKLNNSDYMAGCLDAIGG